MSTTIEKTGTSVHDNPYSDPETVQAAVEGLWRADMAIHDSPYWPYEDGAERSAAHQRQRASVADAIFALGQALDGEDFPDHLSEAGAPPPPAWATGDPAAHYDIRVARHLVLARRRLALAVYWCDSAIASYRRREELGAYECVPTFATFARDAALRAGIDLHYAYEESG